MSESGLLQLIPLNFTLFINRIAVKPNSPRLPSRVVGVSWKAFTPCRPRMGLMPTSWPWWQRGCWLLAVPGCLRCLTARCSCQPAQETPFQKDVDGKPCSASDSAYGLSQVTSPHLERER